MKVKLNGKDETVQKDSANVTEVLKIFDVKQPDMVSVQINGEFVNKEDYEATQVKNGDEIDFLYFMGGGNT